MTLSPRPPLRRFTLAAVAVAFGVVLISRGAVAAPRALTIEVLPDTPEIDATALSEAVANELAGPDDEAPAPLRVLVSVDHETNELVVEIRNKGLRISRRVPAPADPVEMRRIAVFLIGNLARDQASRLLQGLHAPAAPADPVSEPEPTRVPSLPIGRPSRPPAPPAEDGPRRVWAGIWGEYDLMVMKSAGQACLMGAISGVTTNPEGYYCTSGGQDVIDLNQQISATQGDRIEGGLRPGNGRILASLEYAVTGNVLVGARIGLVLGTYPGNVAKQNGAAFAPFHFEARATYVIGDEPLFHAGLAPYVMGAAGAAQWSAHTTTVLYNKNPIAGTTPVEAWELGGPAFVSAGAGLRCAIGDSVALQLGPRVNVALGSGGALVSLSPEVGLQVGF